MFIAPTDNRLDLPLGHYIDLGTRDRSWVRTFVVQPTGRPLGALVLLQHMDQRLPGWQGNASRPPMAANSRPGVNPHVRLMAERFASAGYLVVAPSTFSRGQSGRDYGYRFDQTRWGVKLIKPLEPLASQAVMHDIEAGLVHARRLAPLSRVAVVGYCWGGLLAWRAASDLEGVDAAVCHYGGGMDSEADRQRQPRCPVLAQFGSDGRWMSRNGVQAFIDAQSPAGAAGRRGTHSLPAGQPGTETVVHDAPYGFMQPGNEGYREEAHERAHRRTLDFLATHLGQRAP